MKEETKKGVEEGGGGGVGLAYCRKNVRKEGTKKARRRGPMMRPSSLKEI